jgi:hypothetical protein
MMLPLGREHDLSVTGDCWIRDCQAMPVASPLCAFKFHSSGHYCSVTKISPIGRLTVSLEPLLLERIVDSLPDAIAQGIR